MSTDSTACSSIPVGRAEDGQQLKTASCTEPVRSASDFIHFGSTTLKTESLQPAPKARRLSPKQKAALLKSSAIVRFLESLDYQLPRDLCADFKPGSWQSHLLALTLKHSSKAQALSVQTVREVQSGQPPKILAALHQEHAALAAKPRSRSQIRDLSLIYLGPLLARTLWQQEEYLGLLGKLPKLEWLLQQTGSLVSLLCFSRAYSLRQLLKLQQNCMGVKSLTIDSCRALLTDLSAAREPIIKTLQEVFCVQTDPILAAMLRLYCRSFDNGEVSRRAEQKFLKGLRLRLMHRSLSRSLNPYLHDPVLGFLPKAEPEAQAAVKQEANDEPPLKQDCLPSSVQTKLSESLAVLLSHTAKQDIAMRPKQVLAPSAGTQLFILLNQTPGTGKTVEAAAQSLKGRHSRDMKNNLPDAAFAESAGASRHARKDFPSVMLQADKELLPVSLSDGRNSVPLDVFEELTQDIYLNYEQRVGLQLCQILMLLLMRTAQLRLSQPPYALNISDLDVVHCLRRAAFLALPHSGSCRSSCIRLSTPDLSTVLLPKLMHYCHLKPLLNVYDSLSLMERFGLESLLPGGPARQDVKTVLKP